MHWLTLCDEAQFTDAHFSESKERRKRKIDDFSHFYMDVSFIWHGNGIKWINKVFNYFEENDDKKWVPHVTFNFFKKF